MNRTSSGRQGQERCKTGDRCAEELREFCLKTSGRMLRGKDTLEPATQRFENLPGKHTKRIQVNPGKP